MITVIKLSNMIGTWTGELCTWDKGVQTYHPIGETLTLDEAIARVKEAMKMLKVEA